MNLTEISGIPAALLPLDALKSQLRLSSGFGEMDAVDLALERVLRAAIMQVETMTGRALLMRTFRVRFAAWRNLGRQAVPRAPLVDVTEFAIEDLNGTREIVAPGRFHVDADAQRPCLVSRGFVLPQIPVGGYADITFRAGYGQDWQEVPADLGLAVLSLAAALYEDRIAAGTMPPGVAAMIAPYRPRRLLGGF